MKNYVFRFFASALGVLLFISTANASCLAENFPGNDGGQKIQAALNNRSCKEVLINPNLSWMVNTPIKLVSGKTLKSSSPVNMAVLEAGEANNLMILKAESVVNVVVERLVLYGHKRTPSGIEISGSTNLRFSANVVAKQVYFGVYIHAAPSRNILIEWNLFADNEGIDVRSETSSSHQFHRGVRVANNKLSGAKYGIALANCGPFDSTLVSRCEVQENLINPKAVSNVADGSGIDINLSHFALINSNTISPDAIPCSSAYCQCGRGITIDDVMNSRITNNTVKWCKGMGIGVANGAVPANQPWWSTGNIVEHNIVLGNGGFGLFSARDPANPNDHNEYNIWRFNQLYENAKHCPQDAAAAGAIDCAGGENAPLAYRGFVNYAAGPVGTNTFYGNIGQGGY